MAVAVTGVFVLALGAVPAVGQPALEHGITSAVASGGASGAPVRVPPLPPRRSVAAHASHMPVPDPEAVQAQGRLFLRYGRARASCSATLINTPQRNVAVTAGHCLYDPFSGVWASNVVFVPGYDHGNRPFGSFQARAAEIMAPWGRRANTNFDVGVVTLRANRLGRPADVVGGSGWATGLSRWRHFDLLGYPGGALRSQEVRLCSSRSYRANRNSFRIPGPPAMRAFCDMARGSSGGGWITTDGTGSYLNGVTSYGVLKPEFRRVLFSPYFGRSVRRLIRRAG